MPDGTLPYVIQGQASGQPVLLLHGYTNSWRSFERLLPHLPRELRAIAVTQRGHGDADKPEDGYLPDDFAADAAAMLDALSAAPAIIVGHSMGAGVALRLALRHPERVAGLVLMSGFATPGDNAAVRELWNAVTELADPVDGDFVDAFQRSTVSRPVPNAFLANVVRESLNVPARVWRAALQGCMATDFTSDLGSIAVPTLIVWGDRDAIIPRAEQDVLASVIPEARLRVLAGTGHAPHWEEPERVASLIAEFALGVKARRERSRAAA